VLLYTIRKLSTSYTENGRVLSLRFAAFKPKSQAKIKIFTDESITHNTTLSKIFFVEHFYTYKKIKTIQVSSLYKLIPKYRIFKKTDVKNIKIKKLFIAHIF